MISPVVLRHAEFYPTLVRWTSTASATHPVRAKLDAPIDQGASRPTVADMYLRPLEAMAARLEATGARGLSSVKRRFALDTDGLPGTHLELAIAYNCDVAGHTYEFGGKGEPDLHMTGDGDAPLDLEITRATLDDLWGLAGQLERDLAGANLHLTIEVDVWPASIPSAERNGTLTVVAAAVRAAGDSNPWSSVVTLPISGARVAARLTRPLLEPMSRVVIAGGDTAEYLDDLSAGFKRAVEEKCGQYRRQRWPPYTVVIVDVGSATFGWAQYVS